VYFRDVLCKDFPEENETLLFERRRDEHPNDTVRVLDI
jgi:hypothetical protein